MTLKSSEQAHYSRVVELRERRLRAVRELAADNWREHREKFYTVEAPATGPDDAA